MAEKPIATPLPADLPDNWTYGQTVAPAGSDAGLTEQHGYNYLMEQVNAAQEAVNAINEAFSGLASVGEDGKVPEEEIPELPYIPSSQKGAASGVATLGTDGKLTAAQKPAYTASEVGARPSTWTPSAADVGAVPTSRTVNGKPLSSNISLTADDVGAANPPTLRTATLTAAGWSSNTQTVTVQGVETSGQSVRISPATKTDADNWVAAGVWCSEPTTANQLVFTCDTAPTENININVELQEVQS